jgi:Na+-transporting NADH:ubiquinone oxidoreductase subunit C
MSEQTATGPFARFLAIPADAPSKTIVVAVALCLFASMVVSLAAVALRPLQEVNRLRDKQANVLQVAGVYEPGIDVAEAFSAFEPHVLDLDTGDFTDRFEIATFDELATSNDPALVRALDEDPAGLGAQPKYRMVYLLRDESGALDKVILPVEGYGLWSTLYGFIALEDNGNDIFGLRFYQHGETPGLGAEVDNPRWIAQWRGKKLYDEDGVLRITVAKTAPPAGEQFHVDGLAGATLTARGVDNLVRFWMGEQGYGPFLDRLNAGEI